MAGETVTDPGIQVRHARRWLAVVAFIASWPGPAGAETPTAPARHLLDLTGAAAGGLVLPSDVAVGPGGRIYVVDGGNQRVVAFDRQGQYLFSIGHPGAGAGQFQDPVGVGVAANGKVYVADTGNHRIQIFGADGRFEHTFPVLSGGRSVRPIDVAVSPDGDTVYVTGNNKVMAFTAHGRALREWGGTGVDAGRLRYPATLTVASNGSVYVVDGLNARVQVFDKDGKLIIQVGEWGVLPGQFFRPKGVALDKRGRIYVSDGYLDLIEVFDSETHFLYVLGGKDKPQRFTSPGGIAIDGEGRLYVAEMLKNKISVYALSE